MEKEVKNQDNTKDCEEKEVKEVKKQRGKVAFYFSILDLMMKGKSPKQICEEFKISQANLQYYLRDLKKEKLIVKIGYGVWEVNENKYNEVKISTEKLNQVAQTFPVKLNPLDKMANTRIRSILKEKGLDRCLFCGSKIFQIHHVVPREVGGEDNLLNTIPVCPNHHTYIHEIGYTAEMRKKIAKYHDEIQNITISGSIRGHGFMFKLQVPKIRNWNYEKRQEFLEKQHIESLKLRNASMGQRIKIKGNKVWLYDNSLIIYTKQSIFGDDASESRRVAIQLFIEVIKEVEKLFNTNFEINHKYRFTVCRQHYARVKDLLAMQYDREGKKLNVYDDKGLWFVIDNSFNLHEAETVHPKTAVDDLDRVISPFLNDLKKNPATFSEVRESLSRQAEIMHGIQENQVIFDKNMSSHLKVLNDIGEAINALKEEIRKLNKDKLS